MIELIIGVVLVAYTYYVYAKKREMEAREIRLKEKSDEIKAIIAHLLISKRSGEVEIFDIEELLLNLKHHVNLEYKIKEDRIGISIGNEFHEFSINNKRLNIFDLDGIAATVLLNSDESNKESVIKELMRMQFNVINGVEVDRMRYSEDDLVLLEFVFS